MENFIVSARKYRPATFNTVVGQASITGTLKNAIKSNHLAQAFLFCGPRGVGKTTCARILAKTINCFNIGADTEACNQCESCVSFNESHSFNIHELDAASNNSVEDIRSLVEQVRFAPQVGKFSIYIIDEVHMLSQAAFNAFLKTLEEPPAHAIFILATTEKHKIIPTILSRCQIFDFNRIQVDDIASHLAYVAGKENIVADDDALHIIGQKADGALRDALSMFDRIVSYGGDRLTYKAAIDNLNILDYDYYFKVTDAILRRSIPQVLLIFDEILNNGFDGHNFINGLGSHFRNLLVCSDASTLVLLEASKNIKQKYHQQGQTCNPVMLVRGLNIISRCDINYKSAKNARLLVELSLMQLCSLFAGEGDPIAAEKKSEPIITSSQNVVSEPVAVQGIQVNAIKPANGEIKPPLNGNQEAPKPQSSAPSQPSISKVIPKTISISMNGGGAGNAKQDAKNETSSIRNSPDKAFTKEQLIEKWLAYSEELNKKGMVNMASSLKRRHPELMGESKIALVLENTSQEQDFNEKKSDLLDFLRNQLDNFSITIETSIGKPEEIKKPYTAKEKFTRMVEINPSIQTLRQKLDLEIEY